MLSKFYLPKLDFDSYPKRNLVDMKQRSRVAYSNVESYRKEGR